MRTLNGPHLILVKNFGTKLEKYTPKNGCHKTNENLHNLNETN